MNAPPSGQAGEELPKDPIPPLARMRGIGKRFGGVTVLKDVQFEVRPGEVHVLAGENGAGKSTLIKILAGIHTEFDGIIEICGKERRPRSPLEANALGIAVIHQELSLIAPMSIADNIFLGRTPTKGGWVQDKRQEAEARHWIRQLGLTVDIRKPVEQFPIAIQQLIEIAKALSQNARVIVMDEPTSALNAPEVETLFELIHSLKHRGCGIVYITHKMEEIERIADRITVMRDGRWVGTVPASELPPAKLIQWMVGRDMGEQFPRRAAKLGPERLRLENFAVYPSGFAELPAVRGVSITVRSGEILGLGGLQGSGATELFHGLFGSYGSRARGAAWLEGKRCCFHSPRAAIEAGVALLTNDRKATGLVSSLSILANATLSGLVRLSPGGWLRPQLEREATASATQAMHLRAGDLEMEVGLLSGGNQQKVAIAKWLLTGPKILLLDEPTRGIDIGAKREIYQLMQEWASQGLAILLITSEMPELLTLSDRIVVMHRGEVTGEFASGSATPEMILAAAMGKQHSQPAPNPLNS